MVLATAPLLAHEILAILNDITKRLASFVDLEASFPDVLCLADRVVPMNAALVVDARDGTAGAAAWHCHEEGSPYLSASMQRVQADFAYFARMDPLSAARLELVQGAKFFPMPTSTSVRDMSAVAPQVVTIPLVVGRNPVFGVLQIECREPVNETVVAFINAVANQLAAAIDRTYVAKIQSDLRKKAEYMRRQTEDAEAASRAKSRFLANMSHEIRTPLTAIVGFSELLASTTVSARDHLKFTAAIKRNGEVLTRLIDDILDLAKLEIGKITVHECDCQLAPLLTELATDLERQAESRGLALEITRDSAAPEVVHTDPVRLKQILLNVVGNALKFTERGRVSVHVVAERVRSIDCVSFEVRDTGIGISAEEAARLFQPFMQADATTTRKYGGTGLGLALSRSLALALGGDLVLNESIPGRGSTFKIWVALHGRNGGGGFEPGGFRVGDEPCYTETSLKRLD